MFARPLLVLATFSLCVGVEIKFQKLQDRPPLQFSPKIPPRPVWGQLKAPVAVGQQQIRFPEDPLQTVKIFENYTTTNVEKSQDGKNISVIELLGILHDLPPNETLSVVNQRITSTTESNLETLNRLRKTKLEETREGDGLLESSTITTTRVEVDTVVATNAGDREETSTPPSALETTTSFLSHLDIVEEVGTTSMLPPTDDVIRPAKDEQATFETMDSNENKISIENILVDETSSVASTGSVLLVFSTSTVTSREVEEPQNTFRPKDELLEFEDENGIGHTEISTAIEESILTHTRLNNSDERIKDKEDQLTEEVTSTVATTAKSAKIYGQTTWSQDCSDGLNVSRCFSDNTTSTSMDVVLIGSISGGIFLVLVIVISILSVCLCKRSHNRKNVYATMEEEQPKDFTKVGPPVILQDEVFEAGRSRLYTRNTDKVTEL